MIKDRKHIIEILDNIYNQYSGTFKNGNGENFWPFYRIQIGYILYTIIGSKYNHKNDNVRLKYVPFKYRVRDFYILCKLFIRVCILKFKYNNKLKGKALLFGYNDHYYLSNGKSINSYLSPFAHEIDGKIEYEELLLFHNIANKKETDLYNLYNTFYRYQKSKALIKGLFNKINKEAYESASVVNDYLVSKEIKQHGYISNVLYQGIIDFEIKTQTFLLFLKIVNPKLIWTYCFYDGATMALIRASNRLKINSVEYQHSIQPDEHFAYAKWQDIDEYPDFFPAKFWVWQQSDKERIFRNFTGYNYLPKPVFGGNLFSLHEKEINNSFPSENKRGILITLQGEWVPFYLEAVIKEDVKYLWYFRLHPRYPVDKEQLLKFRDAFSEKVEIDDANNLTVYELFRKIKFHITAASGVALESKGFGIKNIITGEFGLSAYKAEIDSGLFSYCTDKDTMCKLLYSETDFNEKPDDNTLEERKIVDEELNKLLLNEENNL